MPRNRPPATSALLPQIAVPDWAATVLLFVLVLFYLTSFWGQAARLLPAPLDAWHDVYFRLLSEGWRRITAGALPMAEARASYRVVEAYLLGLFIPLATLRLFGHHAADLGLRTPARGTLGRGLAFASPALLLGVVLGLVTPSPWGSPLYEALELAAMLPEHFLVFGVVTALMLPGRRLAPRAPDRHAAVDRRTADRRLTNQQVVAVAASGLVFQIIHVGLPLPETLLALPVGLLFAYVTLLTRSIWPALYVHWALNLLPMAWAGLHGGMP